METIKATTKRGINFVNAYRVSRATELSDVYGRYSYEKARAYKWCREQMAKENGECFRIISAGCFFFTVGWVTDEGLRIETAKGSYIVK